MGTDLNRCAYLDPQDGCRRLVVIGMPTQQDCDRCPSYHGPDRGLGDRVHRLAKITGIESLVKKAAKKTGRPCGCQERREALNRQFPRRPS